MIENCRYTYHVLGIAENVWKDQWYIGSRTTHGRTPEEDIGIRYFTSSRDDNFKAQFKAHPEWFVCTILERGYVSDVVMKDDEDRRITESWNVLGRINRTNNVILFERDEAFKANQAAANRKKAQDPVIREKLRKVWVNPEYKAKQAARCRKQALDPVWKAKQAAGARAKAQDPEYQETMRKVRATPEYKANLAAANRKRSQDPEYQETMRKLRATPEWKAKNAAANRKTALDPVWKAKNAAANRKNAQNPVQRAKNAAANRKRWQDPEYRAKNAAANRKTALDPEFVKKISDGKKRARALREAASSTVSC